LGFEQIFKNALTGCERDLNTIPCEEWTN